MQIIFKEEKPNAQTYYENYFQNPNLGYIYLTKLGNLNNLPTVKTWKILHAPICY